MAVFKAGRAGHSDRSQGDRQRHRELVEESIKKNLSDIIAEESIIGQSREKKIKIPIRGIKEYRFMYGNNSGGVGSGSGSEERGQAVGKAGQKAAGQGAAGAEPGEEIFETEITIEEIVNYLFEDLQLPRLERKKFCLEESEHQFKRSGYRRKGIPPKLAKKLTMIEKKKREQGMHRSLEQLAAGAENQPIYRERIPFREDDLRYFRTKEDVRPNSNAVVICIMDTSGSMDRSKKYLARSFFFLLYQFVRYRYQSVEVVFVSHSVDAREVDEYGFFHQGESGGTMISSGYAKALEIIAQRYSPTIWNIYAFHCSDGDNLDNDNPKAVELARELLEVCNLFGYGEILADTTYGDSIRKHFAKDVKAENFIMAEIGGKEDIWPAFRRVLEKEGEAGGELK